LYYDLSRRNECRVVFVDDDDRRMFLNTLGEMAGRFDAEVFALWAMDNHDHLVFRTQRANLSRAMPWLGVTYTNRFNARHSRSGHLFQGRFKNMLVQNDAYLLRLSYYIHRNPLGVEIVQTGFIKAGAQPGPAALPGLAERVAKQFPDRGDIRHRRLGGQPPRRSDAVESSKRSIDPEGHSKNKGDDRDLTPSNSNYV
jgi:REP element-mobilizing transposase RayT